MNEPWGCAVVGYIITFAVVALIMWDLYRLMDLVR